MYVLLCSPNSDFQNLINSSVFLKFHEIHPYSVHRQTDKSGQQITLPSCDGSDKSAFNSHLNGYGALQTSYLLTYFMSTVFVQTSRGVAAGTDAASKQRSTVVIPIRKVPAQFHFTVPAFSEYRQSPDTCL